MSAPKTNYRDWMSKADNDLLNIENNLRASAIPWDTICFHAQQVVEKLLKAFLILNGQMPPRTHDLVALLAACVGFENNLRALEADCRNLTSYAVATRYPDDLYEPGEADGRAIVEAMRRVRTALLPYLPS